MVKRLLITFPLGDYANRVQPQPLTERAVYLGTNFSRLKRKRHPMPAYIRKAIEEQGLMKDYESRPAYQQNDYISWIEHAKRQETREKRLAQLLDELETGGIYMKMKYPSSIKH